MAAGSLLALIDDIASVLDDVALMSKVAAKKTAGVLGDDLALNAQQVTGVNADRELPVVWAVGVGSLKNKAILVPAALAISASTRRADTGSRLANVALPSKRKPVQVPRNIVSKSRAGVPSAQR